MQTTKTKNERYIHLYPEALLPGEELETVSKQPPQSPHFTLKNIASVRISWDNH
jgi:hypothetical protein